jgi:hypothetical protein
LLRKPPPQHVGPDRRHLLAQRGDQAIALLDFGCERGVIPVALPPQRGDHIGGIGAGLEVALDIVAHPQMRVVAYPAVTLVRVDTVGRA